MSELTNELSKRTMEIIAKNSDCKEYSLTTQPKDTSLSSTNIEISKDTTEREEFVNKVRKSLSNREPIVANRVIAVTENNLQFQKLIQNIESQINDLIDHVVKINNTPSINPKDYTNPKYIKFSISIPAIPITPYEKKILLDYLECEYLEPYHNSKLEGYFILKYKKRFFFKNQFILTLH